MLGAEAGQGVGGFRVRRVQRRERRQALVELPAADDVGGLQLDQAPSQLAAPLPLLDELAPQILVLAQQPSVLAPDQW